MAIMRPEDEELVTFLGMTVTNGTKLQIFNKVFAIRYCVLPMSASARSKIRSAHGDDA